MIERILPPAVAVVESFTDPADLKLHPDEEPLVANAVEKRRREFTTVRDCARRAMARLDLPPVPVLSGARGAPIWPAGVVGSMTHCDGYRGAALARAADVASVGIDAEPHASLPDGVLDAIALPAEQIRTAALRATESTVCWDRLLFSAKEAVYKAWFPLTGRWLDFSEADIVVDPGGTFAARLLVSGPVLDGREVTTFPGRFLVDDGLILTAITLPAPR
ncbi:4'-phosphopantetheinyl transferase EntD (siderophore biosynthesis) [Micromonospora pallida]|uniref:4'-phosphopantetheinyl transferase EntD (Siderophore biosynthesis) n=1 Tax=Micromonospora pallida TaxID=145854 RepID=A0A1C6SAR4_9ACTN|nr:4'-phosphopantetheinyl transferase superfamily protein [Micromonospora pallida]SCL26362.1 4'-phosphopantetheinyl transferase EntD (siderophore biosynthesis) [Micromonospora pallida]